MSNNDDDKQGADGGSALRLRGEADKARKLAAAAFGVQERQRLLDVAAMLDREAAAIDATLASKKI